MVIRPRSPQRMLPVPRPVTEIGTDCPDARSEARAIATANPYKTGDAGSRTGTSRIPNLKPRTPNYVSPKLYTKVELTVTWSTDS